MEDDSEIIEAIQRKTGPCGLEAKIGGSATKVPMLNFYHTLTTYTIFPGSSIIHTALPWESALALTFWLLVTSPCQVHTLQKKFIWLHPYGVHSVLFLGEHLKRSWRSQELSETWEGTELCGSGAGAIHPHPVKLNSAIQTGGLLASSFWL